MKGRFNLNVTFKLLTYDLVWAVYSVLNGKHNMTCGQVVSIDEDSLLESFIIHFDSRVIGFGWHLIWWTRCEDARVEVGGERT